MFSVRTVKAAAVLRWCQRARMERYLQDNCRSAGWPFDESDLPPYSVKAGADYLAWVSDLVSKYKHKRFLLKNPVGATLTIGPLEDTIYREKHAEVNGWGKFYLPNIVSMQVVGVVEGTSCPCDELVLMTCEYKNLYAYDGEELHLVASDLKQLYDEGIKYPASESYYNGEAFKDMTKEDWANLRKGTVGRRLDQEHHKLVTARKTRLLESLKISRNSADGTN